MSKTISVMQYGKDRSIQVLSGKMFPEPKEVYLSWNPAYFCYPPLRKIYLKYKRKKGKKCIRDQRMIRECILSWQNEHWMRNSYTWLGSTQSKWTHAHAMKYFSEYFLLFLQIQKSMQKGKEIWGFFVAERIQNLKRKQI